MGTLKHSVAAGEFKSKCLGIMETIHESGHSVIITKRGIPIVKIIPYSAEGQPKKKLFGALKGTITINGDIVESLGERWEADE